MNKKGFSLIEMLTVVIIVGILSSVAIPQYRKIMEKGRFTKAQAMAKSLYDSCERLVAEFGVESWVDLPASKKQIDDLDVVGVDVLPLGFNIASNGVLGKGFVYTISGNCNVNIRKLEGNYKADFVFTGSEFLCTDRDPESCNVYGLD